jgi:hypothetical protein
MLEQPFQRQLADASTVLPADLCRHGAFLGASALVAGTAAGRAYREALAFVFDNQQEQKRSHVQSVVRASLEGEFGGSTDDVWVSPLASLYWCFSLETVARSHLFLDRLKDTETIWEVTALIRGCRKALDVKPPSDIPL